MKGAVKRKIMSHCLYYLSVSTIKTVIGYYFSLYQYKINIVHYGFFCF